MNTERIYFYFLSIIPNWIQERRSVGCRWSLSGCVCAAIRADGSHLRVSTGGPDWLIRFLPAGIKAASGASWKCSVVMASFWQGVLLLGLGLAASVRAGKWGRILSSFAVHSWKLGLFFCVCVFQTWKWTVSLVLYRWCGRRPEPGSTRRATVWVPVSPTASPTGRPSSGWTSTTVTSVGWCVCEASNSSVCGDLCRWTTTCVPQVTGDVMVYSNDLRYMPTDQSQVPHVGRHVVCTYPRWVFRLRPPESTRILSQTCLVCFAVQAQRLVPSGLRPGVWHVWTGGSRLPYGNYQWWVKMLSNCLFTNSKAGSQSKWLSIWTQQFCE